MNVRELIEVLQKITNKELPVTTEGCDCFGDVGRVVEDSSDVMLYRS